MSDICKIKVINEKAVKEVNSKMLDNNVIQKLSEIFKVLSDPTRVKILYALSIRELCVCELSAILGMSQSAVSHQLRLLRSYELVKYRREGKSVYYSLHDDHVVKLIKVGVEHVSERYSSQ